MQFQNKQIKFNEPAVLQGLLNKTKTSTIRKAYKTQIKGSSSFVDMLSMAMNGTEQEIIDKPCKYEVGKIYEAVWTGEDVPMSIFCEENTMGRIIKGMKFGKVKITSIEKIEIMCNEKEAVITNLTAREEFLNRKIPWSKRHFGIGTVASILSETEGFSSVKKMFSYLESYAPDIKERAMSFWLIKWVWV